MIADGIPEIAQAHRLGHILGDKIQQTYSHVATEVERRLLDTVAERWEKAVADRGIDAAWRGGVLRQAAECARTAAQRLTGSGGGPS